MSLGKFFGAMLLGSILALIIITEFWGTDHKAIPLVVGTTMTSIIGLFLVMMSKRNVVVIHRDED
ncbi:MULTISPECIES: hypothetical protein [unclassified Neisseria]|uniref:hypothetical protein n=1 Tax=unclassified Neisseria TaxID=2623750 RepID=UPI0026661DB1|nr:MULTISPECIES: hypothetical protein [unclassified Neisseria]MDO1509544.1 hypothetical protein [Neisseria sp. MVDL19-042950]MDO1515684.1 hypothetical protein [Neisseria sp. MVDL18-041461]MDO1563492.1 hypothetical protein [Neisseria sp. MVDL20-010259]